MKCSKAWANGKGRARRAEYWWFYLFALLIVFGFAVADASWTVEEFGEFRPITMSIVALYFIGPYFSVSARRLHDVGMSGWLALLAIIPYIGWLFMLVVACLPGQDKANQYGPDPKAA